MAILYQKPVARFSLRVVFQIQLDLLLPAGGALQVVLGRSVVMEPFSIRSHAEHLVTL